MVILRPPTNTTIPEGLYEGRLVNVETKENANGKYMHYRWQIITEEGETVYVSGFSSTAFGAKAKARKIVEALIGRRIQKEEAINTSDLVGKVANLEVSMVEKDGTLYNAVDSVSRVGRKDN